MSLLKFGERLSNAISRISRAAFVDRKIVKETIKEIQRALLLADVNVDLVLQLSRNIEERTFKEDVPPGFTRRDIALKVVYEELTNLLGGDKKPSLEITKKPYIIMLVGIQGSGKTTSAAKLSYFYKEKMGLKPAIICADNFRPGALAQLMQLATPLNVPVYGDPKKTPIEIAENGIKKFIAEKYDIIIIDTAGRHKEEKALLEEMRRIADAIKPDEVMLVIDATIGKQAGIQAKHFHEATPLGSIFLTKLDGAAKGGGALAAIVSTGASIKFIGTGEKIEDIEVFDPPSFVNRLLGMGDLRTLVEKLKKVELMDKRRLERIMSGKLTLLDFKDQLKSLRHMGSLSKIFELLPGGLAYKMGDKELKLSEEKLKKWLAALDSMTQEELLKPSIINRSRIQRIARGAGVSSKDVRDLLKAYEMARKQLKLMSRRNFRRLRSILGKWSS